MMESITSKSTNESFIRQWIKELTDLTPQQVERVIEERQETYKTA